MKIKNLLLLGLLTMSGIEAFAADAWTKVNGVVYKYNDAAPDDGATVEGVLQATNATTVSIEAAITYPEDPSKKLKVVGFAAKWYNFGDHDAYDYQDVRTVTQNLNVDVSNLTGMFSDQAQLITSLKKLTLSGEYTINNYRLEGVLNTYMTELDLSGLKGHEKVLIAKVDGNVQKITLPTQQPVEILTKAFEGGALTELTIPSNVTVIAADAFVNTAALAKLTIDHATITAIADDLFADSPISELSIKAPELTSIGANAFAKYAGTKLDLSQCPKLVTVSAGSFKANAYTEVKLAGTAIDQANFEKITGATGWLTASANSLVTLTLPAAITTIPAAAFNGFIALKGIAFPDAVTEIKENAFNSCIALEAIALNKVQKIGKNAFDGCSNAALKKLEIGTEVTSIGADAFANMTSLEEITIKNNNLAKIDTWFSGDNKVKKISLESTSVKEIAGGVFADAVLDPKEIDLTKLTALEKVDPSSFPTAIEYTKVQLAGTKLNNAEFVKAQAWLVNSKTSLTAITLPETVTEIAGFKDFTALKGIDLTYIKSIAGSAFEGATGLESIDLKSVENIGSKAFYGCNNAKLKALTIPESVKTIGENAFAQMTALETVTIDNDNLTAIDPWFAGDAAIATLTIDAANLATIKANAFADAPIANGKLTITAPKLATIEKDAFAGVALTEVNFNNLTALATVDNEAFKANAYTQVLLTNTKLTAVPTCFLTGATASLTALGLPADMTVVDGLDGLTALKAIKLPKKATEIAPEAFKGCTALESIAIPALVTKIGYSAFEHTGLTSVDFSAATALATIGNSAFASTQLTEVKIPATIAKLEGNVFANNSELVKVDFSEAASLEEIEAKAFNNDPKLLTLDLDGAAKLKTITDESFPANAYTSIKAQGTLLAGVDGTTAYDNFNLIDLSNAKTTLEEVTLPDGLTKVADEQFSGFTALKAIGLPKAVTEIGTKAFYQSGLVGIKIKNKVETIGKSAFQECANLAAVNLSDAASLTEIGEAAFADCPKLTAIDFAGATKLATVGKLAFYGDGLTTVKVTGSIEEIGEQAFYKNKLESVDFTEAAALTTIGARAFDKNDKITALDLDGATALTKVAVDAFPKNEYTSVKTAGTLLAGEAGDPAVYYDNFSGSTTGGLAPFTKENILSASNKSLTELTFPAGYKMDNYDDDLAYFENLTSISLPADLTEIPDDAFKDANITSFVVSDKIVRVGQRAFMGSDLESIDFSNATALETIDKYAFANTASLEAIGLPKNLKVIEENVLEGSAVKGIKIKNRVTTIKGDAFRNSALEKVNFEDATALESIVAGAFAGTALTEIDLSNATSLTKVDDTAFPQNKYTKVLLAGTALAGIDPVTEAPYDHFNAEFKTILANSTASLEEITLPLELTEIADNEFENFAKLTAIGLPAPITRIGKSAFKNSGLVGIKIKKNVKTIDESAFEGCGALSAVNMTEATALETIGYKAFAGCYAEDADGNAISGLTSIVIPAKVSNIGQEAFAGCKSLATADFSQAVALEGIGTKAFAQTALTSVDLSACASLTTLKVRAFPANEYTSVKLGGTILTDESFQNFDFSGATATLAELTLPETITVIPDNWFGETNFASDPTDPETWMPFSALTSIVLPEGITLVGKNAFQGAALTEVTVGENVATIDAFAFEGCEDLATVDFSAATALINIGRSAFQNTAVAEVAIPANADDSKHLAIGKAAFADNASLTSFTAESWAGGLADNLFQNCVSLPAIDIPATITSVGNYAFDGCVSLASVNFEHAKRAEILSLIGDYAFRNCEALTALDLSKTKLVHLDSSYPFEGCTALAEITFPDELRTIDSDGIFADTPIENFEAPYLETSDILFGLYREIDDETGEYTGNYLVRDKENPNTTLKTVKMAGTISTYSFAFCTALETAEWLGADVTLPATPIPGPVFAAAPVEDLAFFYCTGLQTFTYEPENTIETLMVDDDAFVGCLPYVLFATNSNYLDYVATWHKGAAPLNTTFGEVDITKVQTVQDKANASQFVAKYVNNGPQPVYIDANDAKVYSIYVDGDKAYFQALRTFDGKYVIQPQAVAGFESHVIIVTKEAKEVSIHRMFLNELYEGIFAESSIGHDNVYDSQEDDDLAMVQYNAKQAAPGVVGLNYLYRLTNTSGVGFGFTAFTGTTIKAGQFFIVCSRKPNGAGRLEVVWLDEDGNVEGEATGIETVKNIDVNNDAIYNLQGVRVDNPVKGRVYIQNGKKIVVK